MSRLRIIKRWPSPLRLLVLFVVCALLFGMSVMVKDWLTYTRTSVKPPLVYHLSGAIVGAVVVPLILVSLSWSEQRFLPALSEAIVAAAGIMIPAAFVRL